MVHSDLASQLQCEVLQSQRVGPYTESNECAVKHILRAHAIHAQNTAPTAKAGGAGQDSGHQLKTHRAEYTASSTTAALTVWQYG